MSEMTIAVVVVSASCHHLTRADSGWSRISWFSRVTLSWLRGGTSVAPWRHKSSHVPIFRRLFDRLPVRISTSDLHHRILQKKTLSCQSLWFWSAVFLYIKKKQFSLLGVREFEENRRNLKFMWPSEDGVITVGRLKISKLPFNVDFSQFTLNAVIDHHLQVHEKELSLEELQLLMLLR